MKHTIALIALALCFAGRTDAAQPIAITRTEYEDRVNAIWHGQILAVFLTLQFEHKTAAVEEIDGFPKPYHEAFVDDDWYYEMCAVRGFEKYGIDMTVKELGQQWLDSACGSYGSSAVTLKNLRQGIQAPDCGHPRYNRLWWTIGPVFSSELYGAIAPGMPNEAARMAREYGHVNGYAEAVDGAMFNAGAISIGFIERDTKTIVRRAVELLDPNSPYRQCVQMVINLADQGQSFETIAMAIEDRWHIEYPASNNAVPNGGLAAASLWFGEGDFWKTINLASRAADFTDTDNSAAGAIAVIAAMHGMKALLKELVSQLNDRIVGTEMNKVVFTPAVDERISTLANRTADIGEKVIAARGGQVHGNTILFVPQAVEQQPSERFSHADLMQYWNPEWTLHRAGFGGDGVGAMPGIRGITYLDGETLVTFPRDEARGLFLRRSITLGDDPTLRFRVGAEPQKAWELLVYAGNQQLHSQLVVGDGHEIKWQDIQLDLSQFAGQKVVLRLYQRTLMPGAFKLPSNAYWKKIEVE